jgi:hypothetical protein
MEKAPESPPSEAGLDVEHSGNAAISNGPRSHLPAWKWISICVALYLGALLYGSIRYGQD